MEKALLSVAAFLLVGTASAETYSYSWGQMFLRPNPFIRNT